MRTDGLFKRSEDYYDGHVDLRERLVDHVWQYCRVLGYWWIIFSGTGDLLGVVVDCGN